MIDYCAYCGEEATGEDHIIAISRGGLDVESNKIPCCIDCNRIKNDKPLVNFLNDNRDRIKDDLIEKNVKLKQFVTLCNVTDSYIVTQGNATDIDIDIEKEYSAFFEEVWKLYPNKKGKSKIPNSKKKELYKYKDQIKTCIERYISDKPQWQEWQNGSTFFNKGFEDYLDENYLNSRYEETPRYNLGSEKYL